MRDRTLPRLVPRNQVALVACLILVSVIDSVMVGYNSSLMGSLNVMPSYSSYFSLTTATKSLNTAISYTGGAFGALFAAPLVDMRGRRESIVWAAAVALIGGVIQGCAQNVGMFIAGRFIVGTGMAIAQTAAPTLVAETTPVKYRGFALGLYYACWGIGTLIASGVCYGTQSMDSTWAWRIPSLLQSAPSVLVGVIILFVPESPRYLIARDRHDEALDVLSIINDTEDEVQLQYREIVDTLNIEKQRNVNVGRALMSKANRRRLFITTTFSIIVMLPGTNIVTFYFGDMMTRAGIDSPTTQLQINIVLTSWTLVVAIAASWFADKVGRKTLCSGSLAGQVVTLFLLGGLTKVYGTSTNTSGIYGTLSIIFLYNAAYAWGITPLTVLYPPEVLSFDIRAAGMGIYTFTTKLCGLFVTMVVPFGLQAMDYQFYFVNACFDVLLIVFVVFVWVETRGLTLEEVDKLFDKEKREAVAAQLKEEVGVDVDEDGKGNEKKVG